MKKLDVIQAIEDAKDAILGAIEEAADAQNTDVGTSFDLDDLDVVVYGDEVQLEDNNGNTVFTISGGASALIAKIAQAM